MSFPDRHSCVGVIERYRKYLPVGENTPSITLGEGDTPLIEAVNLPRILGTAARLFLKYEGMNPTGSFKDRGMVVAVAKALEEGSRAIICASTGNTSASAAAYAARAGIKCIVLVPSGKIALGKLAQACVAGAKVLALEGNFDEALSVVRKISCEFSLTLVNSLNPYRIEGQKTAAFEIVEQLGEVPDFHFLPVGNAGNITAYWKGYTELYERGVVNRRPVMCGIQAEGAAPLVLGKPVSNPETVATAIRIGNPASWKQAVEARDNSGGVIEAVSDEEILHAYRLLASSEGLFVEPASAASLAGFIKLLAKKRKKKSSQYERYEFEGAKIAFTLTGHGLKDPDTAIKCSLEPVKIKNAFDVIIREAGLEK